MFTDKIKMRKKERRKNVSIKIDFIFNEAIDKFNKIIKKSFK
jgi:hypothetical protein